MSNTIAPKPRPQAPTVKGDLAQVVSPDAVISSQPARTELQDHIAFFETLGAGGAGTGVVQAKGTREGLRALGLAGISVPVGGVALTAPFSIRQNKSLFANKVAIDRIKEGVRADGTDAGVFQKDGTVDPAAFKKFWANTAGAKGYISEKDIAPLTHGKPVSALEFGLLMDLAAKVTTTGERVLTLDTMLAFYDGSLFADLAKARESNSLYKPNGAIVHDGVQQIAKSLSGQALQLGGVDAGEGAKAIGAATMTIDDEASLQYQQKTKTLGPTLAGAFKAMCPAGKG